MITREKKNGEAGFALIELLVALALLALAVTLMPGALRLGARAWEARNDLERASASALAMALVERRISEAMAIYERDEAGGIRLAFVGTDRSLSFIAAAANGPAGGGVYRHRLGTGDATGAGLALAMRLYRPAETDGRQQGLSESRLLVASPATARFRYYGAIDTTSRPQWHETWSRADAFPALVEIVLAESTGKRRSVVAPRLDSRPQ